MANLTWVGIIIGIIGQAISSLGLVLQKRAHARNESKKDVQKKKYVCDPRWLLAFLIFFAGNMMQVVALALAPQSIVSALVVLVLVFNAIFAPLLLKNEVLQKVDIIGIAIIISGIVLTIVFGPRKDESYSAYQLLRFFIQLEFLIYGGIVIFLIFALMAYNYTADKMVKNGKTEYKKPEYRIGRFTALTFAVLPAILSSFNALFSKICGELVLTTARGDNQFVKWETYLFIAIFIVVDVTQIIYLQRALRAFNVLLIIPLYQVSLTIFGVASGGIYFQEFNNFKEKPTSYPIIFALGILISVFGVLLLSRRAAKKQNIEEGDKTSESTSEACKKERKEGTLSSETSSGSDFEDENGEVLPPISAGTLDFLMVAMFQGVKWYAKRTVKGNEDSNSTYQVNNNTNTTSASNHHHHHHYLVEPPNNTTSSNIDNTNNTKNTNESNNSSTTLNNQTQQNDKDKNETQTPPPPPPPS